MSNATKPTTIDFLSPHTPVIEKASALGFKQDGEKEAHIVVGQQTRQLITIASNHVATRDNSLQFDESALAERRIAEADIWTLSKYVDVTNEMILDGTFVASPGGLLVSKSPLYFQGTIYDVSKWKFDADVHWWGVKFEMNEAMTQDISVQLLLGVGAAALLAILEGAAVITAPKAVLTAIVGVILAIGVLRLQLNCQGNGVCIYFPWTSPGINWISPR